MVLGLAGQFACCPGSQQQRSFLRRERISVSTVSPVLGCSCSVTSKGTLEYWLQCWFFHEVFHWYLKKSHQGFSTSAQKRFSRPDEEKASCRLNVLSTSSKASSLLIRIRIFREYKPQQSICAHEEAQHDILFVPLWPYSLHTQRSWRTAWKTASWPTAWAGGSSVDPFGVGHGSEWGSV